MRQTSLMHASGRCLTSVSTIRISVDPTVILLSITSHRATEGRRPTLRHIGAQAHEQATVSAYMQMHMKDDQLAFNKAF